MSTKYCKYCRTEIDKKATVCPNCQRKQSSGCLTAIGAVCIVICALLFVPPILTRCMNNSKNTSHKSKHTSVRDTSSAESEQDSSEEDTSEDYNNNQYYEIVDSATYPNSIGYTVIVDKVMAKRSCCLESTIIATDTKGNVIGKSSDRITLTEGEANYFEYLFDSDVSNATLTATVKERKTYMRGEPDGVEMTAYNTSDYHVYLSLRQNCNDVGDSQFKVLFYKDDKIVHTESGHFMFYAKNLTGKGSEDVADLLVTTEFDRIEYIYES